MYFHNSAYNLAKNPTSKTDVVGLDNMAFKKIVWMTRFSLDASSCIAQKCEVIMDLTTAVTFSILLWDFWRLGIGVGCEVAEGNVETETKRRGSRWWSQRFVIFTPTWDKIANLTNIFQMGWNHQLGMFYT